MLHNIPLLLSNTTGIYLDLFGLDYHRHHHPFREVVSRRDAKLGSEPRLQLQYKRWGDEEMTCWAL